MEPSSCNQADLALQAVVISILGPTRYGCVEPSDVGRSLPL